MLLTKRIMHDIHARISLYKVATMYRDKRHGRDNSTQYEAAAMALREQLDYARAHMPRWCHLHKVSFVVRPPRAGALHLWTEAEWQALTTPIAGKAPKAVHSGKARVRYSTLVSAALNS